MRDAAPVGVSDPIATIQTALDCAHPVTGEQHEAVEKADAALDSLAAALAQAEQDRDEARRESDQNYEDADYARTIAAAGMVEHDRLARIVRWLWRSRSEVLAGEGDSE